MELPVSDGIVRTEKDMAGIVDLTDEEIQAVWKITVDVNNKYMFMYATPQNLQAMEDELKTRIMNVGVLVAVDPTPVLHGKPPILDIVGKVSTDSIHKYGMDHERKKFEVLSANSKGEAWHGQKEATNQKAKARNERRKNKNL